MSMLAPYRTELMLSMMRAVHHNHLHTFLKMSIQTFAKIVIENWTSSRAKASSASAHEKVLLRLRKIPLH